MLRMIDLPLPSPQAITDELPADRPNAAPGGPESFAISVEEEEEEEDRYSDEFPQEESTSEVPGSALSHPIRATQSVEDMDERQDQPSGSRSYTQDFQSEVEGAFEEEGQASSLSQQQRYLAHTSMGEDEEVKPQGDIDEEEDIVEEEEALEFEGDVEHSFDGEAEARSGASGALTGQEEVEQSSGAGGEGAAELQSGRGQATLGDVSSRLASAEVLSRSGGIREEFLLDASDLLGDSAEGEREETLLGETPPLPPHIPAAAAAAEASSMTYSESFEPEDAATSSRRSSLAPVPPPSSVPASSLALRLASTEGEEEEEEESHSEREPLFLADGGDSDELEAAAAAFETGERNGKSLVIVLPMPNGGALLILLLLEYVCMRELQGLLPAEGYHPTDHTFAS